MGEYDNIRRFNLIESVKSNGMQGTFISDF